MLVAYTSGHKQPPLTGKDCTVSGATATEFVHQLLLSIGAI